MARPPTVSRPWLFNDGPPDLTLDLLWRVYATALSQVYYCPPKGRGRQELKSNGIFEQTEGALPT